LIFGVLNIFTGKTVFEVCAHNWYNNYSKELYFYSNCIVRNNSYIYSFSTKKYVVKNDYKL